MIQIINTEEGKCISLFFRRKIADIIFKKNFLFIQFGRKTKRWIFFGENTPKFLSQHGWRTNFSIKKLYFGTTKRPLKIRRLDVRDIQKNRANERNRTGLIVTRLCSR